MAKRLTVLELADARAEMALAAAAESTLESAKVADRERSGCLVTQRGRIIRKRKVAGQYVSQARNIDHGVSVTQRPVVQVKPAPEVAAWDAMVKADRVLVRMGCRSALVKVIKDVPKSTAIQCGYCGEYPDWSNEQVKQFHSYNGNERRVECAVDGAPSRMRAMVAASTAE